MKSAWGEVRRALVIGLGCLWIGSAAGCGGTPAQSAEPPPVRVRVATHPQSNLGQTVRMLVRQLDDAQAFRDDDYAAMVRLAAAPDETVLTDRFLRPSSALEVAVRPDGKKLLAIYVFFSAPDRSRWKVLAPEGTSEVQLWILENRVEMR
jgi:hypothetical protein